MRRLGFYLLFFMVISCSKSRDVERTLSPSSYRYSLLSQTSAKADGFSDLSVTMKVVDFYNRPVAGYSPQFNTNLETGINHSVCESTNSSGETTCILRAHRDGIKNLTISSSEQSFQFEFLPAHDSNALLFDAVSGAHSKLAAGTDTVTGTAGKKYNQPRQTIPSTNGSIRTDVSIRQ